VILDTKADMFTYKERITYENKNSIRNANPFFWKNSFIKSYLPLHNMYSVLQSVCLSNLLPSINMKIELKLYRYIAHQSNEFVYNIKQALKASVKYKLTNMRKWNLVVTRLISWISDSIMYTLIDIMHNPSFRDI